jgi:hypothetical protein
LRRRVEVVWIQRQDVDATPQREVRPGVYAQCDSLDDLGRFSNPMEPARWRAHAHSYHPRKAPHSR